MLTGFAGYSGNRVGGGGNWAGEYYGCKVGVVGRWWGGGRGVGLVSSLMTAFESLQTWVVVPELVCLMSILPPAWFGGLQRQTKSALGSGKGICLITLEMLVIIPPSVANSISASWESRGIHSVFCELFIKDWAILVKEKLRETRKVLQLWLRPLYRSLNSICFTLIDQVCQVFCLLVGKRVRIGSGWKKRKDCFLLLYCPFICISYCTFTNSWVEITQCLAKVFIPH